jgi:hypothetical protein
MMLRSFRFWCFVAALMSLATAALHVVGGGPEFHDPALASSLPAPWKAAFSTIWHEVSALLFLNAIFLAFAGLALRKNTLLLWLVFSLNAAFGVLFLTYGVVRLGSPWVLMQWIIFATISLSTAAAIALRDSLRSVEEVAARPDHFAVLPGANFADTYVVHGAVQSQAIDAARGAFGRAPAWIDQLLQLRHFLVRPFGLVGKSEHLGPNRIGLFPILHATQDKVVLGLNDKHLDFRVVVELLNAGRTVSLTTLVKPHNLFGRAYLALVMPFHRLIAPTILRQAVR